MTSYLPEFFRPIPVTRIDRDPSREKIEANEKERAALAERFFIPGIKELTAEFLLMRTLDKKTYDVQGNVRAVVSQVCTVTEEVFDTDIIVTVDELFTENPTEDPDEMSLDEVNWELPEPIIGGVIDLGELAAQHVSLELDPYPRKPGIEWQNSEQMETPSKVSPFALLKNLKKS